MMSPLFDAQHWLSNTVPQLPSLTALSLARHIGWAVVLACVVRRGWFGLGWLPNRWRAALACAVALAALVPGPLGLTYWLSLAFQVPSLMTVGLAMWCLMPQSQHALPNRRVLAASLAAVALGWVLLLDTLAMLPLFIYPWGYGNTAVAAAALTSCLLWASPATRGLGGWGVVLVAVFALTHLPSGNLWDALIDPWLWLVAHGVLVRAAWRTRRAA